MDIELKVNCDPLAAFFVNSWILFLLSFYVYRLAVASEWCFRFLYFGLCELLLFCAFMNHSSSAIVQRHRQPSEAAADHPSVWFIVSCWWCETLFVICHMDTCQSL